jgi:nucleotide-binding universal stress UspA family protein
MIIWSTRARGVYTEAPFHKPMEILVPITGSGVSLRGMEAALAIAKAASAPITALPLASAAAGGDAAAEGESEKRSASSDDSEVLREVVRISEYFSVYVHSIVGKADTRETILKAAGKSSECLIVLGVSRRPRRIHALRSLLRALKKRIVFPAALKISDNKRKSWSSL